MQQTITYIATRYVTHNIMIRSFGDNQTQQLFNRKKVRKLPPEIFRRAKRKLNIIDAPVLLTI